MAKKLSHTSHNPGTQRSSDTALNLALVFINVKISVINILYAWQSSWNNSAGLEVNIK